jgi:uncharacterized protein (TIGR03435 family)
MRSIVTAGLSLFMSFAAFAQSTPAPLAFEVASVKPAPPPTGPGMRVQMSSDAGRLNYANISMMNLLAIAFAVKEHQISGPDWLRNERFDVTAKLPEGATKDQVPAMLQTLLAERFKLTTHKDSKTLPVYALVVAKNGPKLHAAEGEGGMRMMMGPKGRQMTGKAPIGRLADMLSNMLDRPVIDLTEIKGTYDIDLLWSPDGSEGGGGKMGMRVEGGPRHDGGGIEPKIEGEADAPSIFTALQEKLGLKLDARKSPVDIITVDTLEKIPTEN